MTDFPELDDDFGAPTSGNGSSWLAQEREVLGDTFGGADGAASHHDYESSASAFPALDDDDGFSGPAAASAPAPPAAAAAPQPTRSSFVSSFERDPAPAPNASVTGHDELSAFENQFPEVETAPPSQHQPTQNGFSSSQSRAQPQTFSSAPPEPDTEPIRQWREKRNEEIRKRDERSAKKHQDNIERAEKAIDDFYQDYNSKKERQIAKNKEEEAAFVGKRTDQLAQGTTWERISDLVDLQDSRSKTSTRSTRDLSRFKEALLALKREGETAPGAAGF